VDPTQQPGEDRKRYGEEPEARASYLEGLYLARPPSRCRHRCPGPHARWKRRTLAARRYEKRIGADPLGYVSVLPSLNRLLRQRFDHGWRRPWAP
jgi:hypothetical protein